MKKGLKLLALLLWMALIFYLSAQPADDSTITTNLLIDFLYNIYKFIFTNKAIEYSIFVENVFAPIRKLAHFSEFMVLGILFYVNINKDGKKHIVIALALSCIYAISDEIHQLCVPGRYCAITDMIIDTCGAAFGIFLTSFINERWKKD